MKYCPQYRQYPSVEDMNEALLEAWTSVVKSEDSVYFLGDMAMNFKYVEWILPKLTGSLFYILGNHDHAHPMHKKSTQTLKKMYALNSNLKDIQTNMMLDRLRLNHFPYYDDPEARYAEIRPKKGAELYLAHGHVHSPPDKRLNGNAIDVGWDAWGRLVDVEEVISEIRSQQNQ